MPAGARVTLSLTNPAIFQQKTFAPAQYARHNKAKQFLNEPQIPLIPLIEFASKRLTAGAELAQVRYYIILGRRCSTSHTDDVLGDAK